MRASNRASVTVRRTGLRITGDPSRVLLRPFLPGTDSLHDGSVRIDVVLDRIRALSEADVEREVERCAARFAGRHDPDRFGAVVDENARRAAGRIEGFDEWSQLRCRLMGMYFTHEYSIEAAALGNPSIVSAPDQSSTSDGELRVVMSLRAVGEGHLSSIAFRSGTLDVDGTLTVDETSAAVSTGEHAPVPYDRAFFAGRIAEEFGHDDFAELLMSELDPVIERVRLDEALASCREALGDGGRAVEIARFVHWLADANYVVTFDGDHQISERVLFPTGPSETNGMEDARFVRFVDDDGTVRYYGTYTAYDGHRILPQLLETADFVTFRIATLRGARAQNKGIALFPRRIDGCYVALGRHDNVNNFVMSSTNIREWSTSTLIQQPTEPWELMQLGNCGSPIETGAGWLVITHGVGTMRRYSIGALLLDLHDPTRVIGHLREPLLEVSEAERDGYVPNVVYSCGAIVHAGRLVLPYGYSDVAASVASVDLDELIGQLTNRRSSRTSP